MSHLWQLREIFPLSALRRSCMIHLQQLLEKSSLWLTTPPAATCILGPPMHHFIPLLFLASCELRFLQSLCPAGFSGGFSFQLNGGGKMMFSIPFDCRLSQSPREVNSRGCLLTEDPSAKKLQKANWSEAFTE